MPARAKLARNTKTMRLNIIVKRYMETSFGKRLKFRVNIKGFPR
jgi:hypothetical protein